MAKEHGLGFTLNVDDSAGVVRNLSNDINTLSFSTPRATQDMTGIDKSARETLLVLADFSIQVNGTFNDAVNLSHAVFKTVPSTSVARTVGVSHSGQTLNNETNFTDYALTRPQSGELTWAAPGVLADGTVPAWS